MLDMLWQSLWRALKSGFIAAVSWTCVFSAILWFFSKPTIPYFNFVSVLAPYAFAFFGIASVVFEFLARWIDNNPKPV